jgi:hypothetical protein
VGSSTLTVQKFGSALAFSSTAIGTNQWLVECLVSLALDYGKNRGWVQLYAPSPSPEGLKKPRCLFAGAAEGWGNAELKITSELNKTSCRRTASRQDFSTIDAAKVSTINVTGYGGSGGSAISLEERCAALYPGAGTALAPFNFEGAYTFPDSGNAVKVNISNASVLTFARSATLTPVEDTYVKAACVKTASELSANEAKLRNGNDQCMFLKMSPAAGVLQIVDWSAASCFATNFTDAKTAVGASARVVGKFLKPREAPNGAPPPPAVKLEVQEKPVVTFSQTFTMPKSGTVDDLAIALLNPCAAASIRAAYAASLGVDISSVLLSQFTMQEDNSKVALSLTDAGDVASRACAGSRRLEAAGAGRARQGTSPVVVNTTLVNPGASAQAALKSTRAPARKPR